MTKHSSICYLFPPLEPRRYMLQKMSHSRHTTLAMCPHIKRGKNPFCIFIHFIHNSRNKKSRNTSPIHDCCALFSNGFFKTYLFFPLFPPNEKWKTSPIHDCCALFSNGFFKIYLFFPLFPPKRLSSSGNWIYFCFYLPPTVNPFTFTSTNISPAPNNSKILKELAKSSRANFRTNQTPTNIKDI